MNYIDFKKTVYDWFDLELEDDIESLYVLGNENAKEYFGLKLMELIPEIEAIDLMRAMFLWERWTEVVDGLHLTFRMDIDLDEIYNQLSEKGYLNDKISTRII